MAILSEKTPNSQRRKNTEWRDLISTAYQAREELQSKVDAGIALTREQQRTLRAVNALTRKYGLTGKPDYVVETRAGLIPIEVKSRPAPSEPYDSHIWQLAAYCLLVEEFENQTPAYGIISYADAALEIDYTTAMRRELLAILDEMRRTSRGDVKRSHKDARRCAGCGYRQACDQSLT